LTRVGRPFLADPFERRFDTEPVSQGWQSNATDGRFVVERFSAGTGDRVISAFDNFSYVLEVPEPSPMLLTAFAVATLGMIRRSRRVE
jgi:hypothetical protein